MAYLNSYSGNDNFWVSNPQTLIHPVLKSLYDKDKSKKKEESSKIMYALCFYLDVSESNKVYGHVPPEDRKVLIARQFLKDESFKWDKYLEETETLKTLMLTPAQVSLFNFYNKLKQRDDFIRNTDYSIENSKELDAMMVNTKRIWDQYFVIMKEVSKEASTVQKGGKNLSLSDKGAI
jgi:hypothetical protein